MLENIAAFFKDYPQQILQLKGKTSSDLPDGLMAELLGYRERSLSIIEAAQHFQIDEDAFSLMADLINEMKRDGLEELYSTVRLPFPSMTLSFPSGGIEWRAIGLVSQVDETIYVQRLTFRQGEIGPSTSVLIAQGLAAKSVPTPTYDLFRATGIDVPERVSEDELSYNKQCLGVVVALATLLRYEGMLKEEEVSLYPRQQRRQAARSGTQLPDKVISRITLGKAGRGQVEAMRADTRSQGGDHIPRRTHWVRGHLMRSRSGELVWRMPHIRGAGPLIKQLRHVTGKSSKQDPNDSPNPGKERPQV